MVACAAGHRLRGAVVKVDVANHLGRLLRLAFRQQAAEVGRVLSPKVLHGGQDSPRLEYWPERLAAVVKPLIVQLYQQGITQSRRRLAALQGGKLARVMLPDPSRVSVHPRHTFGEKAKQLGVSFDLFDPLVLRAVDRATLQFCEETNATAVTDLKTAIKKLRVLLKEGLEEGKAIAQLAREVKRIFASPYRAYMIAASEGSRAVHAGALLNAQESHLKLKKEWLASSDACQICLDLDGIQKELDEPFVVDGTGPYARIMTPPRHPHCCLGETPVFAPGRVAGIESQFEGPILSVTFADGYNVAVTPNHLFLTAEGFMPASAIMQGDKVICCAMCEWKSNSNPYDDRKPSLIKDVVHSLSKTFGMASALVPASAEYLHGDGAFCNGNIDVVGADSFLGDDAPYFVGEHVNEELFGRIAFPNGFNGGSDFDLMLQAIAASLPSGKGKSREAVALFRGSLRREKSLSIASSPQSYAKARELPDDNWTADTEEVRKIIRRFPGKITLLEIRSVNVFSTHYLTPVFDLETTSSLYCIGNGVVNSNCFCTMNEVLA